MLNCSASLAMSTSVLKALPDKLDIKIHSSSILSLYNKFSKLLDEGKDVRAVFCDISKAFDRVWQKILLCKLNYTGIYGTLLH